jgi:RNase P/RNase MRP subunit p30
MTTISTTNINEARKEVDRLSNAKKQVIVLSQDDDFNRKILENKKVDILIINEDIKKKDYLKQRDSSLNEILAKIAAKNNINIAIDIDKIASKPDIEQAKALARLKQNIMLCKKAKTSLIAISKKDKKNIISLFLALGASTRQAKQSTEANFFN